ncbi:MAG TPA: thiol-activated cytolysin family protein [Kofleriaceae bacterium]
MTACSSAQPKETPDPGATPADQIDQYIAGLPYLAVDAAAVSEGDPSAPAPEGDYQCTTQQVTETQQYDRVVAYAANSDSMYPGAIVSADSVLTGLFTQIVLPRSEETISVSLENLAGTKQAKVADSSLGSYRDALSSILDAEITGSTAANLSSEIEEVHSEQQLNMALGVQASWGLGIASLKTSFNWNNQDIRSRYVVRYTQTYYTVDLNAPQSPSSMFAPEVTLGDVQGKMDPTHPPAYVSSVTYGRMVVFTFESQYSSEEMGAALDFAYSGGIDISGNTSVTYKDIISNSKITAFILGGDAGTAVQSIDSYDSLINFIKTGGNYSRQSPGAAIAYKLSYLKDNSPARMSFTTDYDVKTFNRVSQKVRVTLDSITVDDAGGDAGGDLELYGTIKAEGTSTQTLWSLDSDHNISIKAGNSIGNAQQPLAEIVLDVAPSSGHSIKLHPDVWDRDTVFTGGGDDNIGNDGNGLVTLPFDTGWRKTATMTLTGDGARVLYKFTLTPI